LRTVQKERRRRQKTEEEEQKEKRAEKERQRKRESTKRKRTAQGQPAGGVQAIDSQTAGDSSSFQGQPAGGVQPEAFRTNWKRKATEMRTELHRARHELDALKISYEYLRQEMIIQYHDSKTSHQTLNAQLAAAVIQHDQDKNRLTGLADNWKNQAIRSRWEGFEAGKESGFNEGKKCGETEGRKKARIAIDAVIKSTWPPEDIPGQGIAQPKPGSLSSQSLSSMGSSSDAASREARG
jgi:hypothetical protein